MSSDHFCVRLFYFFLLNIVHCGNWWVGVEQQSAAARIEVTV